MALLFPNSAVQEGQTVVSSVFILSTVSRRWTQIDLIATTGNDGIADLTRAFPLILITSKLASATSYVLMGTENVQRSFG